MSRIIHVFLTGLTFSLSSMLLAQPGPQPDHELRIYLQEDKAQYLKLTLLNQIWMRYTEANPGSLVYDDHVAEIYDIGLRRTRFQLYGPISSKVYVYFQFGQNNYSYLSKRFEGFFIHDATAEYRVHKTLHLGTGLSGWSGMSRFTSPAAGSILGLDAPLYQQATNSVSDQFLRKLSVYAKGKFKRLDYRFAISKPSAVQNSNVAISPISQKSEFNTRAPRLQKQGYVTVQLMSEEQNDTPYNTGTYLGNKKVFNIGAGFIHQSQAQWHLNANSDTVLTDMLLAGIDFYFDVPLNEKKANAISVYAAVNHYDFGPNYSRNIGVMNPSNGADSSGSASGSGNAFPMISSGVTTYLQLGYLFKKFNTKKGRLGIYASSQISNTEYYDEVIQLYEGGINWYIDGDHSSKITFALQNRPVMNNTTTEGLHSAIETDRKSMVVVQFQILK